MRARMPCPVPPRIPVQARDEEGELVRPILETLMALNEVSITDSVGQLRRAGLTMKPSVGELFEILRTTEPEPLLDNRLPEER